LHATQSQTVSCFTHGPDRPCVYASNPVQNSWAWSAQTRAGLAMIVAVAGFEQ